MANGDRQSDSCGVVAAIVLVLLLVFSAVAVGGFYFLRVWREQRQVMIAEEQAVRARDEVEQLRLLAEAQQDRAQVPAETVPELADRSADSRIIIRIDQNGKATVVGQPDPWDDLGRALRRLREEHPQSLSAVLQVDGQCRFEHVARVLALCKEAGIENSQVESLDH